MCARARARVCMYVCMHKYINTNMYTHARTHIYSIDILIGGGGRVLRLSMCLMVRLLRDQSRV